MLFQACLKRFYNYVQTMPVSKGCRNVILYDADIVYKHGMFLRV